MVERRTMKLGFSVAGNGAHRAGWRHPKADANSTSAFAGWREMTRALEAAKIHFMFLADGAAVRVNAADNHALSYSGQIDKFEPLTLLSAISSITERLGLVATASTTYNEPYTVARKYASLDHLSGGRAGWNVVTSWSEHEAQNFNRSENPDHTLRYRRAEEFVDVVMALWDGWEDGAFIRDKASGQYVDPAKLHDLFYRSENFAVRGPLNVERPVQGYPVIAQAGASEPGQELAARTADIVYTAQSRIELATSFYGGLKRRMAKYGRRPEELHILPGLQIIIGSTEAEAQRNFEELQGLIHVQLGLTLMRTHIPEIETFALDEPLPDRDYGTNGLKSALDSLVKRAREGRRTVRQLCMEAATSSHNYVVGTPETIADLMEAWFRGGACDGFSLQAPYFNQGVYDILDGLLPELRRRGLFQSEYAGATLRENLGLERPANQYTEPLRSRVRPSRQASLKAG